MPDSLLFFDFDNQVQFVQLFLINDGRSIQHVIASAVVLRECNTVNGPDHKPNHHGEVRHI